MAKLGEVCEVLDSKRVPITAANRVSGQYPYYGANGVQDYVADYIFDDELVLLAEDGGNFGSKEKPIAYRVSGKCWVNNHAHVLKPKAVIDVDYLCYSLMFYDVSGLVNGATRQKLTQSDMRKMEIPLRTMVEQKKIVCRLNKLTELISLRKQQLAKLDELVKARYVEMFETRKYPIEKLGRVCEKITDGTHKTPTYLDSGIKFISAKNILDGKVDLTDTKYISKNEYQEIQKRCQVEIQDILLTKSGTLGIPAIIRTDCALGLFESLAVIKYDRSKLLPYFLYEQLRCNRVQRQFKAGTKGVAVKHLHLGVISDIDIIVPPISYQLEFSDFAEQVDKQKQTVQQSLEKLELMKKALMQEYFG